MFMLSTNLRQFIRFCIVGVMCTGIDMFTFYIVHSFTNYQVAIVCGYTLSFFINYFLTVFWTFQSRSNIKKLMGMVLTHLFNLFMVRMGLMHLFVNIFSLNENIAYMLTLVISVVSNFIIIKIVVNRLR